MFINTIIKIYNASTEKRADNKGLVFPHLNRFAALLGQNSLQQMDARYFFTKDPKEKL